MTLGNKQRKLAVIIGKFKPAIICFQEMAVLEKSDPPPLHGYTSYRNDTGWGVAMYVSSKLPQRSLNLQTGLVAMACRVKLGYDYFVVCSIYCSPSQPLYVDDIDLLRRCLLGKQLLLGDFSAHHQLWGSERCTDRTSGKQYHQLIPCPFK